MNETFIAVGSFDRQNLFYGVKSFNRSLSFVDELVQEVSKYINSAGSTIIYCTTVKDTEQVFFFCLPFMPLSKCKMTLKRVNLVLWMLLHLMNLDIHHAEIAIIIVNLVIKA